MTIENYEQATKYLGVIERSEKRLKDLEGFSSIVGKYNPTEELNRVYLTRQKDNRSKFFYLEVMDEKMVNYLVDREKVLLKARITKCRILLSKL